MSNNNYNNDTCKFESVDIKNELIVTEGEGEGILRLDCTTVILPEPFFKAHWILVLSHKDKRKLSCGYKSLQNAKEKNGFSNMPRK